MLYNCTSLGDRTPTAMLQHMRTMQPKELEGVLFRYIFVNLLPYVVWEVVSSMESLDEMAETAGEGHNSLYAFQCDRPATCPMRDNTCAPPAGNTPAGRD